MVDHFSTHIMYEINEMFFYKYLEARFEISEHGFNLVRTLCVLAETRLADDRHSGVVRNLLKRLSEVAQRVFANGSLRSETRDRPFPDFDSCEKLFSSHVPHSLIWKGLLLAPASVLKFRRWQNSSSDLHEAVADVEAELLNVRVVVEVGLSDQAVDFSLAIGGRSGCGFYHGGRLHVGQLLDASLALDDVADLQG